MLFSDSFFPLTQNKVRAAGTRTKNNSPWASANDESLLGTQMQRTFLSLSPIPSDICSPAAYPKAADTKQVAVQLWAQETSPGLQGGPVEEHKIESLRVSL